MSPSDVLSPQNMSSAACAHALCQSGLSFFQVSRMAASRAKSSTAIRDHCSTGFAFSNGNHTCSYASQAPHSFFSFSPKAPFSPKASTMSRAVGWWSRQMLPAATNSATRSRGGVKSTKSVCPARAGSRRLCSSVPYAMKETFTSGSASLTMISLAMPSGQPAWVTRWVMPRSLSRGITTSSIRGAGSRPHLPLDRDLDLLPVELELAQAFRCGDG